MFKKEIYYIDLFKTLGYVLKNTTPGGEGKYGQKIDQYSKEGNFIKRWESMAHIQQELNTQSSSIAGCCLGKDMFLSAYGFVWRYENEAFDKYRTEKTGTNSMAIIKPIYQIDMEGNIIQKWNCAKEITDVLELNRHHLLHLCRSETLQKKIKKHNIPTYKGFYWSFEENLNFMLKMIEKKSLGQLESFNSRDKRKPVYQIDPSTRLIVKEFTHLGQAAKELNCSHSSISMAALKESKKFKGFLWKYKEDYDKQNNINNA